MMNCSSVVVPPELIDLIIDQLHDDRVTLAACSQVCKAWLPRSRYHLFGDVLLGQNGDRILALSPPSAFALAARRLMLGGRDVLPSGIEQFSNVKNFYLTASTPGVDMLGGITVLFSTITLLELNQTVFASFSQMIQLVCALPHLETLTHFMCLWITEQESPPDHLRLPPRLRTLNFISLRLHIFLDWMNGLESMPPISTIRLYGVAEPHMAPLAKTIKRLGEFLEHLTIDLWDHGQADILTETIDLSHSNNLRSFTLLNGWPKLLHHLLLSHMRQPGLRKVALSIFEGGGNIPSLDLLDWSELDALLTSSRTAFRLTDLMVRVYAHSLVSCVDREMVEHHFMPLCAVAGIIRFVPERERSLGVRQKMSGPISPRSWTEEVSS